MEPPKEHSRKARRRIITPAMYLLSVGLMLWLTRQGGFYCILAAFLLSPVLLIIWIMLSFRPDAPDSPVTKLPEY